MGDPGQYPVRLRRAVERPLEAAGAEPLGPHGLSLLPVLRGGAAPPAERAVFIEHETRCVIRGHHKLIADFDCTEPLALYHVVLV